jgi:hypothetical protein
MVGNELLPLIKASDKKDRFSENLMKWVRKYRTRNLIVAIATEGIREFDPTKTQSPYLYIGYSFEDGFFMGSRLSEILCNGSRAQTWSFQPKMQFVVVPDWWMHYIADGKCCIDPEHYLYGDRERWEVSADGKTRKCLWCGNHTQQEITEMVPKKTWVQNVK